jgi:hypothetical protein
MADLDKKTRAMTDANVLVAGMSFPRWPCEVLRHAAAGDFQLVLCPLVIEQARRNLQKHFPQYTHRFEEFLQAVDYELVPDPTPKEVAVNQSLNRDLSRFSYECAHRRDACATFF